MSLATALKSAGKDLSHVGAWIDEALKVAGPAAGSFDPPLIPIFAAAEAILDLLLKLPPAAKSATPAAPPATITAAQLQAVIQAVTVTESVKAMAAKYAVAVKPA